MNTINSLLSHRFHLLTEANSPNLPTEYAYCGQYPINAKKLKHVEKLLNYIPDEYINFYNDIMAWQLTKAEEASGHQHYIAE